MKINPKINRLQIYITTEKKKFIASNIPKDVSFSEYVVEATLEKVARETGKKLSTD